MLTHGFYADNHPSPCGEAGTAAAGPIGPRTRRPWSEPCDSVVAWADRRSYKSGMSIVSRLPRIDPDALVVQHLFQPVVDWLGIDPERWAWKLYRAFVITMVTAGAAIATMGVDGTLPVTPFGLYVALPFMVFGTISMMHVMLRFPSNPEVQMVGPFFRLAILCMAIHTLPVVLLSVFGEADMPSHAVVGHTPLIMRVMGFSLSLAFPLGAAALYVRICRRPPPKPPRRHLAHA